MELIVGLLGALIGGGASVTTVIMTNRKAAGMKQDDYRREELDRISDAIAAARKSITRINTEINRLHEIGRRARAGEEKSGLVERISTQSINQDRIDAEVALVKIAHLVPHPEIRRAAGSTNAAISHALHGMSELMGDPCSDDLHSNAVEMVISASNGCNRLQAEAINIYYPKSK